MTSRLALPDSLCSVLTAGAALTLTVLAGCAPSADETRSGSPPATAPSSPTSIPSVAYASADACGVAARQDWVGRSVASLPAQPPGANWRRVCTTCQRTDDFRPERLNVVFDAASGRVVSVHCG